MSCYRKSLSKIRGCSRSGQAVYIAEEMYVPVNGSPEDSRDSLEASEDFQRFRVLVREHIQEGRLPDVDGKKNYKLYRLRAQKFGAHESIVVTNDDENYITIELLVDDQTKQTSLGSMSYDGTRDKLKPCGVVQTSAHELFVTAYKTLKKFGPFNKLFNNCQDFCNDYLKNIGFPEQRKLTDPKKITHCGIDCG